MSAHFEWDLWLDRGGTFTDCVARQITTGELRVAKVRSSLAAPAAAARQVLRLPPEEPIPPCRIRMGTTLATNALLERRGSPCGLVITRGFADLLEIGDQTRQDLFDLRIHRPRPVVSLVTEIDARVDANGAVLARPSREEMVQALAPHIEAGLSIAIVVVGSYQASELELELAAVARQMGALRVCVSSRISPRMGLLDRAWTSVLDAYLTPTLEGHIQAFLQEAPGSSLLLMKSSGALAEPLHFRGPDALLSGPAAGALAVAQLGKAAGLTRVIGFDMGGTSTDVCRAAPDPEMLLESRIAGIPVQAPTVAVHTVAAGGGSLCRLQGHRLVVGPESAGADPGPLCYGDPSASEPTLTDVNLVLGRVRPEHFPLLLHADRARQGLCSLATQLGWTDELAAERLADGYFQVATSAMVDAIRTITVAQGEDPRGHALMVFGGAGGQHACALARQLGIKMVLSHRQSGVLSAFGMSFANVSWQKTQDIGRPQLDDEGLRHAVQTADALEREGQLALAQQGHDADRLMTRVALRVRVRNSETVIALPLDRICLPTPAALRSAFEQAHQERLGYTRSDGELELHEVDVEVASVAAAEATRSGPATPTKPPPPRAQGQLFSDGKWHTALLWHREDLPEGASLTGPAIITDPSSTLVVDVGWKLDVWSNDVVVLRPCDDEAGTELGEAAVVESSPDPALLEVVSHRLMAIAAQMGRQLQRTAMSTSIRERLDFSCAVFDAQGRLVANAPHIPVHLGAMGATVRAVKANQAEVVPGDVFICNDPALGGSHLPDITVVNPVFSASGKLCFFTACRGHHADVGGTTPGSMPPFSKSLAEEGVVFRGERLARGGEIDRELLRQLLLAGPYPARRPAENLSDIEAQVSSCRLGGELLLKLAAEQGPERLQRYMDWIREDARVSVEQALRTLSTGQHRRSDQLDDGSPVVVSVEVTGEGHALIDFEGTAPEQPTSFNAPRAVTMAAVLYVLRALVGRAIPLNEGCFEAVTVVIPERSLLAPGPNRAVSAGNVETSQRVVDVLLGAMGLAAASQGTMNNLTLGSAQLAYYETIGGGTGAGPTFHGASAVHSHMTNTRLTDVEVLESRFPVRVSELRIRRGSGGQGQFRGGDGLIRELVTLVPLQVAIVAERRTTCPFGLAGGSPGVSGRSFVNGQEVGGRYLAELPSGSTIRIETPGGGGWGSVRFAGLAGES